MLEMLRKALFPWAGCCERGDRMIINVGTVLRVSLRIPENEDELKKQLPALREVIILDCLRILEGETKKPQPRASDG